MQEQLISYLLGDLGPEETAELEQRLANDPELAAQLERLRECMGMDDESLPDDDDQASTPTGLADRTHDSVCLFVSDLQNGDWKTDDKKNKETSQVETPAGRSSFSMLDAVVAIGVVAAVMMMLVPALRDSRESARRRNCSNQLREIGYALRSFADNNGGYLPMPPRNANAGSFTISLADNGYVDRTRLANNVVCPGSPEANRVARGDLEVRIPTFDELESAEGEMLATLRRVMSLSFAYRSPYQMKGELMPIHSENDGHRPLMSDAPTIVDSQWRNMNHGCGLNVLFEDGHVDYLNDCREPVRKDHLFVNARGQAAPPVRADDAVLMRSEYVPRAQPVKVRVQLRIRKLPASAPVN